MNPSLDLGAFTFFNSPSLTGINIRSSTENNNLNNNYNGAGGNNQFIINTNIMKTINPIDYTKNNIKDIHDKKMLLANQMIQQFHEKYQQPLFGNYNNQNNQNKIVEKLLPNNELIGGSAISIDSEFLKNSIIINGTSFADEAWRKQMEYDKFMNEIWIGIVFTLIITSFVFCLCSCFLYHQFRQWKLNYRNTEGQNYDIESVKLNTEDEDPVPEYTLVSGLPSYEAALDMLQRTKSSPKQCVLVYPSVFSIFTTTTNEKDNPTATSSSASYSNLKYPTELDKISQNKCYQAIPSYEDVIINNNENHQQQLAPASVNDGKNEIVIAIVENHTKDEEICLAEPLLNH